MPEDFRSYLNQPPEKMDNNAIKYWSLARNSDLKDLAIKSQFLIATSVPSERLFSKAGKIMTEERNIDVQISFEGFTKDGVSNIKSHRIIL